MKLSLVAMVSCACLLTVGPSLSQPGTTIDKLEAKNQTSFRPDFRGFRLFAARGWFQLSDGRRVPAGDLVGGDMYLQSTQVDGDRIRYELALESGAHLFYESLLSGVDRSYGGGELVSPLVLQAPLHATVATLSGLARIVKNEEIPPGEPAFHYYTVPVGSVVPFTCQYELLDTTWELDSFDSEFRYRGSCVLDFAAAVYRPRLLGLRIDGPSQAKESTTVPYRAIAEYDNGVSRGAAWRSEWNTSATDLAQVPHGLLRLGAVGRDEREIQIEANYVEDGVSLTAQKIVRVRYPQNAALSKSWLTHQANPQHSGYVPGKSELTSGRVLWQRDIGPSEAVSPIAAADGRVFATITLPGRESIALSAFDATSGDVLWSRRFDDVYQANPPAVAFGNVYIEVARAAVSSYGGAPLYAFSAANGSLVFRASLRTPMSEGVPRYLAPTPYDGVIYAGSGRSGGVWTFDAFSGISGWQAEISEWDGWAPSIAGRDLLAYVGPQNAALFSFDRVRGDQRDIVVDTHASSRDWDYRSAPAVNRAGAAFVIAGGRLMKFDAPTRSIAFELSSRFEGDPSVADGKVFAIDDGRLTVLDEIDGTQLWDWSAPEGPLRGQVIVTDSDVILSSDTAVHSLDSGTHQPSWSLPVGGKLALANDALYVTSSAGVLTAISLPLTGPPTADPGADRDVECQSDGSAAVWLDGSGSSDPDGDEDIASYRWSTADVPFAETRRAPVKLELGAHGFSLEVTDRAGSGSSAELQLDVVDTTPPTGAIISPAPGCYGPSDLPLVVHDTFQDSCRPQLTRDYEPGGSPLFSNHGDQHVVLTVRDAAGNAVPSSVDFTIDTVAPKVYLADSSSRLLDTGVAAFGDFLYTQDNDGARGYPLWEAIHLDGCTVYDGREWGNRNGSLIDDLFETGVAIFCRAFELCGQTRWSRPVLRGLAGDCGGNVGASELIIPGRFKVTREQCEQIARASAGAPRP